MFRPARGALFPLVGVHVLGAAGAQEDRGFYLGFEAGTTHAATLGTVLAAVNHPTRCDALLYPDPAMAEVVPENWTGG